MQILNPTIRPSGSEDWATWLHSQNDSHMENRTGTHTLTPTSAHTDKHAHTRTHTHADTHQHSQLIITLAATRLALVDSAPLARPVPVSDTRHASDCSDVLTSLVSEGQRPRLSHGGKDAFAIKRSVHTDTAAALRVNRYINASDRSCSLGKLTFLSFGWSVAGDVNPERGLLCVPGFSGLTSFGGCRVGIKPIKTWWGTPTLLPDQRL